MKNEDNKEVGAVADKASSDPKDVESLSAEIEKLEKDNEMLNLNIEELSKTNEYLVSATWREREMKQKLGIALEELKETKKIVDKQHKSITDSINYASRIQDAIIPKHKDIAQYFKDIFIMHEAKDIVSGDFPWFYKKDDYVYIAAVDCTGHGVPGAMMSLIGYLLMNDIANHDDIDPAQLLTNLHWAVVKTLKQDAEGKQTSDGMDIALCRINLKDNQVQYAGAHRPLYRVRNGELEQYSGAKFPIGGNQYRGRNKFFNHEVDIEGGDSVYFFSDGLTDQFGGPDGLKYGPKRTREELLKYNHLSMEKLNEKMQKSYSDWKGDTNQIDDVLLIGIKF
ncbi:MAG: SpoIIE family protein phosphatase [Bacteroidota bacterium]